MPLSLSDFAGKVSKSEFPTQGLIQRFIKCHSDRPTITRIWYIKTTKFAKATYGIVISNTDAAKKKYAHGENILMSAKHDGIEIYNQCGAAIRPLEDEARKIVDFLQRSYFLKIEEIVFDFVKDKHGHWWFLGCKGFKLDDAIILARELR